VLLNGKWHFIDKTGHFVLDPPFVQVRSFHNGLASFLDGQSPSSASNAGYIDKTGIGPFGNKSFLIRPENETGR